MVKIFETLHHTADLKIRAYGKDLKELFVNSLKAMFLSIKPLSPLCSYRDDNLVCDKLPVKRKVALQAAHEELLLVDFLSEALYLSDIHNEAYLDAIIEQLNDTTIQVTMLGVPITGFEVVEIKAVTYHDLSIKKVNDTWQAEIVFDI